ncbi:hypothetical protein [Ammoniphilus sp. CFH 90114]|uniref:hypothetical protein n=1 Tax=Ammoniphilus sp. CFH 90114 TaxID=2493665 RepID=UPI00100F6231|nr:hypothetical protein [Ammoniphilus sp. CFH 90114]RXT04848.1 hypothetical protein EIZ39_19180 [Ammoniphilus sp. CFH 90114]
MNTRLNQDLLVVVATMILTWIAYSGDFHRAVWIPIFLAIIVSVRKIPYIFSVITTVRSNKRKITHIYTKI